MSIISIENLSGTFVNHSGNVWKAPTSLYCNTNLVVDNVNLGNSQATLVAVDAAGEWFFDPTLANPTASGNMVYLYSATDPNSKAIFRITYTMYEICQFIYVTGNASNINGIARFVYENVDMTQTHATLCGHYGRTTTKYYNCRSLEASNEKGVISINGGAVTFHMEQCNLGGVDKASILDVEQDSAVNGNITCTIKDSYLQQFQYDCGDAVASGFDQERPTLSTMWNSPIILIFGAV